MAEEKQTDLAAKEKQGEPEADQGLPLGHPLARVFGSRRGDPSLDWMMEGIAEYRRRISRQEARAARRK